ncbi:helix-turn-helix transcriptional regulator [Lentzea sp. BCCO 10_0798]|jgi:DNA-binding NarL/FixJ family response regulator|uniref:Helix-turn-helix transcriptional regulator n=1 Tax=Lentzea kristufekii TaxID=3095430 RepID=A0ABU4U1Q0_9PSEU|nr:helix-turn-helix transcriptional regulator [Lentzea sp. BCCO 10_0798]MDX8054490.1 helix-turn-helix transcriptional regulator [Lentzea sp. BCCO 10_0798]
MRLTPREQEVLSHVMRGRTADHIGREMGISARTVTKHLENAYRKLGATNRVTAVLLARQLGMI